MAIKWHEFNLFSTYITFQSNFRLQLERFNMSPMRIVATRLLFVTTSIQRMRITGKAKIIVHNPEKRILYFQNASIAYSSSTEITVSRGKKVHMVFEQQSWVQILLWAW